MIRNPLDSCINKFVVIEASGTRYFGTLIEVGEEEAVLKTKQRWVTVPVEKIHAIREIDPTVLDDASYETVDAEQFAENVEPADTADSAATSEFAESTSETETEEES